MKHSCFFSTLSAMFVNMRIVYNAQCKNILLSHQRMLGYLRVQDISV